MPGPTIRKRQLGSELRRLRLAAGVSREGAASAIGASPTKITHQESGRNSPRKAELIVLMQTYGVDAETLDTLEELRQEASQPGWWSTAKLPEWLAGYVGLESDASTLRALELELIPGLLQTEAYAREVHLTGSHMTSPDEVDRRVAARMRRQQRLDDASPLELSVVISEAALLRCLHQSDTATGQFRQLMARARQRNVELRVLPFTAGLHGSMSGSFTLLGFADGLLPDAVYQEYAVGGHIVDDQSVVRRLDILYGELRGQALDANDSLALLAKLADTHRLEGRLRGIHD